MSEQIIKVEMGNIEAFISLPVRLYKSGTCPRSAVLEAGLLSGTHVLSKYFEIYAFTALKNGLTISRCAITFYPDDETAYLGFFDSEDDEQAVSALFAAVESFSRSKGRRRIVGPLDASFWLGYRMKVNRFDNPSYFGEPCGLPWYQKLWEQNGYIVTDSYSTHIFKIPLKGYVDEKFDRRLKIFLEKGYRIKSPKRSEWEKTIGEVYTMIMRLYSDFPAFKHISEDDFKKHYAGLKYILDFSMVKMAYWNDKAVGFFIGIPDYGHMLNRRAGLLTLARALLKKIKPSCYVMLYMGVDHEHRGLGKAITQTVIDRLKQKRAVSIGALIHEGKETEHYVEDMIDGKYLYHLFEKHLSY